MLFFLCVNIFSLSLSFFSFSTPVASHTLAVLQFGISVPSFPNVSARNSPQEQDEEQRVRDGWARRLGPDTDAGERQALQRLALQHLQTGAEAPAHPAGGFLHCEKSLAARRRRLKSRWSQSSGLSLTVQVKRKELLQRDDDDVDSMMSSSTSDTNSIKRKRSVQRLFFTLNAKSLHIDMKEDLGPQQEEKILHGGDFFWRFRSKNLKNAKFRELSWRRKEEISENKIENLRIMLT